MTPDQLMAATARKMLEKAKTINAEAEHAEAGSPYKTMMQARAMGMIDAANSILDALIEAGLGPDDDQDDDQSDDQDSDQSDDDGPAGFVP